MCHGINNRVKTLLKIIDMDQPDKKWRSGRFRDIYLNADGTEIIMYTRDGGNNREHDYDFEDNEGEKCSCSGCNITYRLPKHPNFIGSCDDEFDHTYAYVKFSIPDEYKELCKLMATGKDPDTIGEKFMTLLNTIKKTE